MAERSRTTAASRFRECPGAENFGLENNIAIALDSTGGSTMSEYRSKQNKEPLDRFEPVLNMGPKGEGWVAVDPFIMAKNAKDVDASWEVLKFLTSYMTQNICMKTSPVLRHLKR